MKVLKFGGTSVGSYEGLKQVQSIVSASGGEVVVVVSALSGVTDQLLDMAEQASMGERDCLMQLQMMSERHFTLLSEVALPARLSVAREQIELLFEELRNILRGVSLIKDLSAKTRDAIVSYGERISSFLVASMFAEAERLDARDFLKTTPYFERHVVDFESTNALIREAFAGQAAVSVVPGFIGADLRSGDVTNLGRGGSDYTASVIAAALKAEALELWTDVDGFMTADPRVIDNAYVIDHLSFVEAMELCNFGAKVIYPPTIFPAYHENIPIVVRNTFNTASKGTYISKEKPAGDSMIKGISSINDTCLITIRGLGMVGVIGVNYRIFKALSESGISVFFVSQAASENSTSIGVRNGDAQRAVEVIEREFSQELSLGEIDSPHVDPDLVTVAIVGENMRHNAGVAGRLFGTLGRNGINVIACAQGASETNISFVVARENLRKSINVIHDSFFLSEFQVLNIFLAGVGLVGRDLIAQIRAQQELLRREKSLDIRIVGITNSRRFVIDREGVDLESYPQLLADSSELSTPELFRDKIKELNMFNSVFVDCTASAQVASIYQDLLSHNVSVVAANKIAASSEYASYLKLKQTARSRGVKFLFETNVGAGLPIIGTISDLVNSGDKILKIEAVVSGTLNYLFNEMNSSVPMSRAVKMAQEAGYAEPDPRIDLSGMDVIRKLVILSREAGYALEQSDVQRDLFIPQEYFEGSVEQFWEMLPALDDAFEQERKRLEAEGKRWRFVATYDNGSAHVALREVLPDSPFYHLEGSNNVILLTTDRYKEYPMQIKGYGAGASVTAAGVFADIISIANVR